MKYILGAGISALIYKFYNPEFKIIGEVFKGRLNQRHFGNTVYLHNDEYSWKLLTDLNISCKIESLKIQHIIDNGESIVESDEISEALRVSLIKRKTRLSESEIPSLTLTSKSGYFLYWKIDFDELFSKLLTSIEHSETITRIDSDKIYTEDNSYSYLECVSTLPAKVFWHLYKSKVDNFKPNLTCYDTYLEVRRNLPSRFPTLSKDSLWYLHLRNLPELTRLNFKDGSYLFEFTEKPLLSEAYDSLFANSYLVNSFVEKDSVIHSSDNKPPIDKIKFIGRFAVNDHNYKINNSIKDSIHNY